MRPPRPVPPDSSVRKNATSPPRPPPAWHRGKRNPPAVQEPPKGPAQHPPPNQPRSGGSSAPPSQALRRKRPTQELHGAAGRDVRATPRPRKPPPRRVAERGGAAGWPP